MKMLLPLLVVAALFALAFIAGPAGAGWLFGVALPYAALALLVGGLLYRVALWARAPVPFRIPVSCGQQASLDWIRPARLDNPRSAAGAVGRMAIEVLLFRSLLRNTRAKQTADGRLVYGTDLALWAGALAMHWAMLVLLVRHLRFVTEPVPALVLAVERVDSFLEIGLPAVYLTSVLFLGALLYLLGRRLANPLVRYVSLPTDYFALFLLLGIGLSGFAMRHLFRTDLAAAKELAMGLVRFAPVVPEAVGGVFFGHLFLVAALAAYLPFSKLLHAPGVFLSPTRNLANNNRAVRHVNPWDYPVKVHSYEDYENELREKMVHAGIPVEREPEPVTAAVLVGATEPAASADTQDPAGRV